MAIDIYQTVTDRIIAKMEQGEIPWEKPWIAVGGAANVAYNRVSKSPYSLLNQIILGEPGEYASFNQWKSAGAHVRKGEKGHLNVWWSVQQYPAKDKSGDVMTDTDGKPVMKSVPLLKYNTVFHISQVEADEKDKLIEPVLTVGEKSVPNNAEILSNAEKIFADYRVKYGITFANGGDRAYYAPSIDGIRLPLREQFKTTAGYYSTLAHEHVHSTGHPSRLNRFDPQAYKGNEPYAKEELVAEIGAAICLNMLGIDNADTEINTTAYLQSWLKVLRDDKRMIVHAALAADKAVRMIFAMENGEKKETQA